MKHSKKRTDLYLYNSRTPVCPNAADDQYFANLALNLLTGAASLAGFICAMVVLVMLA